MKIEYFLTSQRVIQCQVRLREHMNVEQVLSACVWFPLVLRVHIETQKCCRDPYFSLDGSSPLTDARLARFVAVEGSLFQTTCGVCGAVRTAESFDFSRLHWRSSMEIKSWMPMPWFDQVMDKSTCTLHNGQEQCFSKVVSSDLLVNSTPTVLLDSQCLSEVEERMKSTFVQVMADVRRCVHPRLSPHMTPQKRPFKTYVVFRQKREEGYHFMVKKRQACQAWPREWSVPEDVYPVVTAHRCSKGTMQLSTFMQSVIQVVPVAEDEFLFVVKWPDGMNVLPGHRWLYETRTFGVHGMSIKYPFIELALGSTKFQTFFHGTTAEAADSISEKGFESNAFHGCSGTYYKCQPPFVCCCKGMLGPGVYCASFDKASANAGRVSGAGVTGSVLECQVLTGECKFVTPLSKELCQCGCQSVGSDHVATWYHEQLFDSVFLCPGAGVKREELCVRRPKRIVPVKQWFVRYNEKRERVYVGQNK